MSELLDFHNISDGLYDSFVHVLEVMNTLKTFVDELSLLANELAPLFSGLATLSSYFKLVERFGEHQFVLVDSYTGDFFQFYVAEDIDFLAERYFASSEQVEKTASLCGLSSNAVFVQAMDAFRLEFYDLAIIGFTAVLDRVLADTTGKIKVTSLKRQFKILHRQLEAIDYRPIVNPEIDEYVLYLTYCKAIELFIENSDFEGLEPDYLNRHWIMHGRTNKKYTRLDCVKVINLIYGTIKIRQIGSEVAISTVGIGSDAS